MIAFSIQRSVRRVFRVAALLAAVALLLMGKPTEGQPSSVVVSRYQQHWTLLPDKREHVVQARMIVEHMVMPGTTYASAYKSVVDDYPNKQVQIIRVTGTNGNDLTWSTFERDGFLFVEWSFDQPLVGFATAATTVEYDIYKGVSGCISSSHEAEATDTNTTGGSAVCSKSFSAGWANYWSIPVHRVQYTFTVPSLHALDGDAWYFPPNSTTLSLDDAPGCCSFTSSNQDNDPQSSQTLSCQCTELDAFENSDTRKKKTIFRWNLVDTSGSIAHCTETCGTGSNGSLLLYILVVIVLLVAILLTLLLLWMCNKRRQRRRQQQQNTTHPEATHEMPPPFAPHNIHSYVEPEVILAPPPVLPPVQEASSNAAAEVVSKSVTETFELNGSKTVTTELVHPDGSKTVSVTKYS